MNLKELFTENLKPHQKQYEAIRAVAFNEGTIEEIAIRFGYTPQSLRMLLSRLKRGEHRLFPEVRRGPKGNRIDDHTKRLIIKLRRNEKLNSKEITERLNGKRICISMRTVERFLRDAGFPKLHRRTDKERGISKRDTIIFKRSCNLEIHKLKSFKTDCKVAGIFLFLPYIIESGILEIIKDCDLPESSDIKKYQAGLSMLLLKLIGSKRLSHIKQFDSEPGFGIFAGLNIPPKSTYLCSYSCRTTEKGLMEFQRKIIEHFGKLYPELYEGKTINLDFHSIPHFGDESQMENIWCGARNKVLKGANTFFASDGESDSIIYSRADIKRSESSEEIENFINYWVNIKGIVNETLVFDSKLTRYDILNKLDKNNVKFITLRRRSRKIIDETKQINDSEWEKHYLPIPKRRYKHVKVHQNNISIEKDGKPLKQLIVKDHGRVEPTFIITNNENMKNREILTIYAKRWHIENKLGELVKFFSLNSLSSSIMIRIHFDILWTIIADTLYSRLARDLRNFEKCNADTIFRQFIDMPGQIIYDGNSFVVKIRKRATTPIIMNIQKLNKDIYLPWLNANLKIVWVQ